jgi:hypothetical protein
MNGWPLELRSRLAKLILLLGSSHDGEIIAAAHALVRTLASARLDLHDLTDGLLDVQQREAPVRPPRKSPVAEWRTQSLDDLLRNVWLASCDTCIQHVLELTSEELALVLAAQKALILRTATKDQLARLMEICDRVEKLPK